MLCPVLQLLALALDDGAFEAAGIKAPSDIYRLKIPDDREALHLRWKDSVLDLPIFRSTSRSLGMIRVSDRAFKYSTLQSRLARFGVSFGLPLPMKLTPYCLRRATANAADGKPECLRFHIQMR